MQFLGAMAIVLAAGTAPPLRPVHTYSIVARDAATGQLGVAVQSHWFSVGTVVPWAEAGVGAVATQSFTEPSYGPLGLALMRAGKSAEQALQALLVVDEHRAVRQVAMVDASGAVAAHTGTKCIAEAGQLTGQGFSVQANIMASEQVWPAMASAFVAAKGDDLAERLLKALEAAQAEGGDIRGRQSAALLVVNGTPSGRPWADRKVDLRVDDSPQPLKELRRLLTRHRAYEHMNAGDDAMARGAHDEALVEYAAASHLVGDEPELQYWHAVALVNMGQTEQALTLLADVFESEPRWLELTPRLVAPGLLSSEGARAIMESARKKRSTLSLP